MMCLKTEKMKGNGSQMELIVRVKRKRDLESSDSICIVESEVTGAKKSKLSSLTKKISNLQTNEKAQRGKLILKRIHTVDDVNNMKIIEEMKRPRQTTSTGAQYVFTSSARITENSSNIFMVDLAHISSKSWEQQLPGPSPSKKGTKILDPATRALHAALQLNDPLQILEQMANAIEQGADVNYQRPSDGFTALMMAAQYSNIRMVSKLLQKGANVFLQNQDTKSAIDFADYADVENRSDSSKQVSFLLRHAASSQYSANFQPPTPGPQVGESDYVYDIYSIGKSRTLAIDDPTLETSSPDESSPEAENDSMEIPTVEVPGIKILQGDLTGEAIFCYDSDWSDLADDEDPDSNDEKFFGNDYPDEDWGDDDDDGDGCRTGCYNEQDDSDYNNSNGDEDDEDDLRRRKVRWNPDVEGGEDGTADDQMPKFDRKGIGRVLKPFIVDGPNGTSSNDKIDVNDLWNLRPDLPQPEGYEEIDHDLSNQTRKDDMARRTGMMIGSSGREFDDNGLPKYGMDLSDDEPTDWTHAGEAGFERGNYNHEAYDSDLDRSSSSNG
jgi:hypothetical protein